MGNKKDFTLKIQIINLDTKSVPQFPLCTLHFTLDTPHYTLHTWHLEIHTLFTQHGSSPNAKLSWIAQLILRNYLVVLRNYSFATSFSELIGRISQLLGRISQLFLRN